MQAQRNPVVAYNLMNHGGVLMIKLIDVDGNAELFSRQKVEQRIAQLQADGIATPAESEAVQRVEEYERKHPQ